MVRESEEQNYTRCNFPLPASNIHWHQGVFNGNGNINGNIPLAMLHGWWFPLALNTGPYFQQCAQGNMAHSFLLVLISLVSNSNFLLCFPLGFLHFVPVWRCFFASSMARTCLCLLSPVPQPCCHLLWVYQSSSGAWAVSPIPWISQILAAAGSIQPQASPKSQISPKSPCPQSLCHHTSFWLIPLLPSLFCCCLVLVLSVSLPALCLWNVIHSCCWKHSAKLISITSGSAGSLCLSLFFVLVFVLNSETSSWLFWS